jgi:ubiquinone/menaquinone biosynthesis C-methylase UbiE
MNTFTKDKQTAAEVFEYAQWISFGPLVFQAARAMRNLGILDALIKSGKNGLTLSELAEKTNLKEYGVRVLVEAGLGMGLVHEKEGHYTASKVSFLLQNHELTRVNMDFTHDVNYLGAFHLEESVRNGKPEGLKVFGDWKTVYEGLAHLPEHVKQSWFNFDHLYSDDAFPAAYRHVFKYEPKHIMDIGCNTGKISIKFLQYHPDVKVTMVDLPGQIEMARKNIEKHGFQDRVTYFPTNLLDENNLLPSGCDTIWMSQFLDCFSDDEIVSILKRCAKALDENGYVYIMEPFWDRQEFNASAFALQQTSLYFTCIANGNSQMYDSRVFMKLIDNAGFEVEEVVDGIGMCQSILRLRKKQPK